MLLPSAVGGWDFLPIVCLSQPAQLRGGVAR